MVWTVIFDALLCLSVKSTLLCLYVSINDLGIFQMSQAVAEVMVKEMQF